MKKMQIRPRGICTRGKPSCVKQRLEQFCSIWSCLKGKKSLKNGADPWTPISGFLCRGSSSTSACKWLWANDERSDWIYRVEVDGYGRWRERKRASEREKERDAGKSGKKAGGGRREGIKRKDGRCGGAALQGVAVESPETFATRSLSRGVAKGVVIEEKGGGDRMVVEARTRVAASLGNWRPLGVRGSREVSSFREST